MEFRVLRDCTALYLAIQALPKCEEASLRPNGEDGELGVSMLWLQNMLGNQSESSKYGGTITIGRKPGSHINLKDRAISSTHATLKWSVDVRVCPSTQLGDLSSAPLKVGDTIRVSLTVADTSTNGTYEGDTKYDRGKPMPIQPGILTIPGTTNALECTATTIDHGTNIYLGRPKSSDAGMPVFAFNTVVCIAESLTANVLNLLSPEQMSAFPHNVQKHCFIGCIRDPRFARIKTEQFGADLGNNSAALGSSHLAQLQSVSKSTGGVGVCIERQQAVRRELTGSGSGPLHQSSELDDLRKQCAQLQSDNASLMSEAERTRVERDRDLREATSKREEAAMEIKLLEKKCLTSNQLIQTLQNENQNLRLTSQKMQESYELAECKRAQIQALLETSESRCVTLEGERYKLSVATTQAESKNKTLETQVRELERRLQDLEREHVGLNEVRRIEAERSNTERDKLRSELEKMRQQIKLIREQAHKAWNDQDLEMKRKLRIFARFHRDNATRQSKYLEELLQSQLTTPSILLEKADSDDNAGTQVMQPPARSNYNVAPMTRTIPSKPIKWSAPSLEPAPSVPEADSGDAADEHCSATDGEDTATVEGAEELATIGAESDGQGSETPIQQALEQENDRPGRQEWSSDDPSKRRRRSSSLTGEEFGGKIRRLRSRLSSMPDVRTTDHLLLPDSQLS